MLCHFAYECGTASLTLQLSKPFIIVLSFSTTFAVVKNRSFRGSHARLQRLKAPPWSIASKTMMTATKTKATTYKVLLRALNDLRTHQKFGFWKTCFVSTTAVSDCWRPLWKSKCMSGVRNGCFGVKSKSFRMWSFRNSPVQLQCSKVPPWPIATRWRWQLRKEQLLRASLGAHNDLAPAVLQKQKTGEHV